MWLACSAAHTSSDMRGRWVGLKPVVSGDGGEGQRAISRGDLSDHKLLLVMKTQGSFDKPALRRPDLVLGDLDFQEPDLTGWPPGEHIEEAAQLPVICGAQPFECLHRPGRVAS